MHRPSSAVHACESDAGPMVDDVRRPPARHRERAASRASSRNQKGDCGGCARRSARRPLHARLSGANLSSRVVPHAKEGASDTHLFHQQRRGGGAHGRFERRTRREPGFDDPKRRRVSGGNVRADDGALADQLGARLNHAADGVGESAHRSARAGGARGRGGARAPQRRGRGGALLPHRQAEARAEPRGGGADPGGDAASHAGAPVRAAAPSREQLPHPLRRGQHPDAGDCATHDCRERDGVHRRLGREAGGRGVQTRPLRLRANGLQHASHGRTRGNALHPRTRVHAPDVAGAHHRAHFRERHRRPHVVHRGWHGRLPQQTRQGEIAHGKAYQMAQPHPIPETRNGDGEFDVRARAGCRRPHGSVENEADPQRTQGRTPVMITQRLGRVNVYVTHNL
mmetsp:Transcript_28261/g.92241  ORF Transcript_28261/g.92241 Transcript_28261/m.92241 type:complete len:398 (-) Transcript_28261:15-1208(-)